MHGIVRYSKLFKLQKVISSKKKMLQFYPILANFVTRKNPHFLSHEARGEPLINNSFFFKIFKLRLLTVNISI